MATRNRKRQGQRQSRQGQRQSRQGRGAAVRPADNTRSRRNRIIVSGFLALVLVLSIATLVNGGKTGKTTNASAGQPSTTAVPPPASLPKPPDGATITGDTPCPKADGSSPRTTHFSKPPPMCISPGRTYTAEIKTTMGTITAVLDAKSAPKTVNNFVVLARYHFFDGISFHRIIPGFVVQGGDPLETGLGGPGYTVGDELPKGTGAYKVGSLAMANSGADTNGSQFFIVSGDTGSQLPSQYSLFGQVTPESLDVVKKIDAIGSPDQSGAPTAVVTIESVTIKES